MPRSDDIGDVLVASEARVAVLTRRFPKHPVPGKSALTTSHVDMASYGRITTDDVPCSTSSWRGRAAAAFSCPRAASIPRTEWLSKVSNRVRHAGIGSGGSASGTGTVVSSVRVRSSNGTCCQGIAADLRRRRGVPLEGPAQAELHADARPLEPHVRRRTPRRVGPSPHGGHRPNQSGRSSVSRLRCRCDAITRRRGDPSSARCWLGT